MAQVQAQVDALPRATYSLKMPPAYDLFTHRHRFAAWCAARAAQRGLKGGTNALLAEVFESCSFLDLLSQEVSNWPGSQAEVDALLRDTCRGVQRDLVAAGLSDVTYGRAAKLVAIYLKTMVVLGGHEQTSLGMMLHPPIDAILLAALSRDPNFSRAHRSLWRRTRWTQLGEEQYDEVIASLRDAGLAENGFWRIERYWHPGA
jgi:hypothetical protein